MRIGFGTTVWARGLLAGYLDGIGVYTERLWHEFSNSDQDMCAVTFGISNAVKSDLRSPQSLMCVAGRYNIQSARSLLSGLPFSGTDVLSGNIDVFHAPDHHIPKLKGVPMVATIMDAIPFIHPEWTSQRLRWAKNLAFRKAGHWADHVITISEYSKHDIIDAFGISEQKITVIPLGYDESMARRIDELERKALMKNYGLREGYFIFVGTLQPRKNIQRVIAAHKLLSRDIQQEHPLVIVGNSGWEDEDILKDIERMERQGHGRWLGGVSKEALPGLMQSAIALVFPSLYEGFGLPVLEGFAAGIPVISSNTTSIPEVAGDAALLVDPMETEAISDAMRRMVEDGRLRSELVRRGNQRLLRFSWQSCARQTLDVYKRVI